MLLNPEQEECVWARHKLLWRVEQHSTALRLSEQQFAAPHSPAGQGCQDRQSEQQWDDKSHDCLSKGTRGNSGETGQVRQQCQH